jgi:hypothetical protein
VDFKNLMKKIHRLKVSRLFPNVCDFQKVNRTLEYGFKNLKKIDSLAYGFLVLVISISWSALHCPSLNKYRQPAYIHFVQADKMPKTTARCLSLLLEDEAMVSKDAVARASIDDGDQRRLSANIFAAGDMQCQSCGELNAAVHASLSFGDFLQDLNNNNLSRDDFEEEKKAENIEGRYVEDQTEEKEELGRKKKQCQTVRQWLENRLKNGFTSDETEPYIR